VRAVEKPLKVALLTLKFSPLLGGDVTHIAHLGRFFAEEGVETHIITIQPRVELCDVPIRNISIHRLGLPATTTELERMGIKRLLYMVSSFLLLSRLLSKDRVDLIHAHGWDPALVGGLFARIFRVPVVLTVHGIPKPRHGISRIVFRVLERAILRLCSSDSSLVVALTNSDKSTLVELGVNEKLIDVIPNGIDTSEFEDISPGSFREEHGISAETFLAIFVGRLHDQKGVRVLLRAAERLKRDDIHLLIIGSGHKEAEYKRLAGELNVSNVLFAGEIERKELLKAFAASDVFVLPSLFEGMPYVVLEAMAAGKPVVASRLPGLDEVIQSGINGVLFEKGSDEDLAQAILHFQRDRTATRKMGEAARRIVEDRFDWRQVFSRTLETYRSVLGKM